MIIDYDHNPNITDEQRLKSLKESVQMMYDELLVSIKEISASVQGKSPVAFTGTRDSAIANGNCYGIYDRTSGLVRINLYAGNSSNISVDQALFTIPVEYRPKDTVRGSGFVGTSSGTSFSAVNLLEDGTIKQRATSSARSVFGYIEYEL